MDTHYPHILRFWPQGSQKSVAHPLSLPYPSGNYKSALFPGIPTLSHG